MSKATMEKKADVRNGIGRLIISLLIIIAEIVFVINLFTRLSLEAVWIESAMKVVAIFTVLLIYSASRNSAFKTPWIILIMAFPIIGLGLYILIGLNGRTYFIKRRYEKIDETIFPKLREGFYREKELTADERLKQYDPEIYGISRYISGCGFPLYQNTAVKYFPSAESAMDSIKIELRRAKKFIFMEYFAIESKETWLEIQEILEEKVNEGVEVRVFYDDVGSISFVNFDFAERMEKKGIRCRIFDPFIPGLNLFLNNRDHRKITVVDGRVAFTGGFNIANEYVNRTSPYGKWSDTGVRLEGEAVRSLTAIFLENWNAVKRNDESDTDLDYYLPCYSRHTSEEAFVQPYSDSPLDNEPVGENVYISMVNKAEHYCYFTTPYLILTEEMTHALTLAAKRGVDVRIVTPGIPDKKLVYQLTRSYYNSLTKEGVRIYEWTPGFLHAKNCVIDDKAAITGTINTDFRSFYHHFEDAVFFAYTKEVMETKKFILEKIDESRDVTEKYTRGRGRTLRLIQLILRLFAPLL